MSDNPLNNPDDLQLDELLKYHIVTTWLGRFLHVIGVVIAFYMCYLFVKSYIISGLVMLILFALSIFAIHAILKLKDSISKILRIKFKYTV